MQAVKNLIVTLISKGWGPLSREELQGSFPPDTWCSPSTEGQKVRDNDLPAMTGCP